MTDTPMTPDVAAVQQAATRAIHALKSPTPDGSPYYQSGWDDGLEAAIDAARDGVEGPVRTLLAEVDRLRKSVADADDRVSFLERNTLPDLHRQIEHHKGGKARWRKRAETAEARVAELTGAPVDEAAEMAEAEAELEAMRREHPAPCRVPDSPDCTCPGTPRPTGLPIGLTGRARHGARVAAESKAAPRNLRSGAAAARRMLRLDACDSCGATPDEWCPDCAACHQGCHGGHANNPCTHPNAPWSTEATS
ncbi:hypothetical protein [Streptomyces sp. A-14]|uniref:hypothetical protein n=1 Tax=Streptomyces sp. A-14 TaxID=3127467 RepID=UPI003EB873C2